MSNVLFLRVVVKPFIFQGPTFSGAQFAIQENLGLLDSLFPMRHCLKNIKRKDFPAGIKEPVN